MQLSFQEYKYVSEYSYSSSMHWAVLFLCLTLSIIIVYQTFRIVLGKRKRVKTQYRYLILGIVFLLYNLLNGLLPNPALPGPLIIQYIITYGISIIMCVYLVWYLYQEFNVITPYRLFKIKNLSIMLSACFILLFLVPFMITKSLNYSRRLFLIFPTLMSFSFLLHFIIIIKKKTNRERYFKIQTYLGLVSILCITMLPLLTFFGDYQPITQSVVTSSFFVVTIMEINSYLYRLKNTYILNQDIAKKYNLTNRENEIALQIVNGDSYKDIAKNMYISYGTVRKHASNIFIKSEAINKHDFIRIVSKK